MPDEGSDDFQAGPFTKSPTVAQDFQGGFKFCSRGHLGSHDGGDGAANRVPILFYLKCRPESGVVVKMHTGPMKGGIGTYHWHGQPFAAARTAGSARADAMHLVRAAAVMHPGVLSIPSNDKGGSSFKLDRLAPANGFNHANAHDALADVEALIFICRIIRDACPALWSRFLRFARKSAVEDFMRKEGAFLVLEFFPVQTGRFVVTPVGTDGGNVTYGYDLGIDPDELRDLDDKALAARLSRSPRPLRKIRKNAAPCLCPLDEAPELMLGGTAPSEWLRRAEHVRLDRAFVDRLVRAAMAGEAVHEPSPHVEKQIYGGFWSNADARRLEAFHQGSWRQRADIADTLEDPRLQWLARRLIFAEFPEALAKEHRASIVTETAQRMLADQAASGGWMTLAQAEFDLEGLSAEAPADSANPLRGLKSYLSRIRFQIDRVASFT